MSEEGKIYFCYVITDRTGNNIINGTCYELVDIKTNDELVNLFSGEIYKEIPGNKELVKPEPKNFYI